MSYFEVRDLIVLVGLAINILLVAARIASFGALRQEVLRKRAGQSKPRLAAVILPQIETYPHVRIDSTAGHVVRRCTRWR